MALRHRIRMALLSFSLVCLCLPSVPVMADNLVANGGFEQATDRDDKPDDWTTSGRGEIHQTLTLDAGQDGGQSAKLECTQFVGGTPDSHAMICQLGHVATRSGQWYRIRFWAKGKDIAKPVCEIAVSNTRPWESSGISGQFVATKQWKQVEILSQASKDVPSATSRLQIWFGSTGTLWLDDFSIEPVDIQRQLHPTIATAGVRNSIPNSSFECGPSGWGSFSPGITTWAGNLNQLCGEIDRSTSFHGDASLRMQIDKSRPLVFRWDYYDPANQPIECALAAHVGWIPVEPGTSYVFSCYLKAADPDVPVRLMIYQEGAGRRDKIVSVSTEWKRYELAFTARSKYLWCAAGPDLSRSSTQNATVWLDALQLDTGKSVRDYGPRSLVESGLTTNAVGNIFTQPDTGISLSIHFWNGAESQQHLSGSLVVTDFTDRTVLTRDITTDVPPQSARLTEVSRLLPGKLGFYRIAWKPQGHTSAFPQSLRCALVRPYANADSPFGMNHAYPWDFMLRLCKTAGLTWMRDWSAKWQTVEPRQGQWDFSKVDPQIDRVLESKLNALILLPFPSAAWCSTADMDKIRNVLGKDDYRVARSAVACPANDPALFRDYVARTVRRYRDRVKWFEVMNEPIYTTYAVPARFGYGLEDYLKILRNASETIKQTDHDLNVIGGIGTWPDSHWVQDFIAADGLKWCDVMDVHLYPVTIPPELYERGLADTWQKMKARGQARPIWLTEFGCYADDDPYMTPGGIGDSAMSRSNWPSEQAASEALVKSSAVFLTHGLTKIFFHAGTCGPINGNNGGGIFFEYGGAPRKMYPALSALANMLGPNPVPKTAFGSAGRLCHYVFDTDSGAVAIAWAAGESRLRVDVPNGILVYDIMGNQLKSPAITLDGSPRYFHAADARTLGNWFETLTAK